MPSEVTYLGFGINKNGTNSLPEKVADLLNVETPKNNTQLKSFLDMLNYYHRNLPNYLCDLIGCRDIKIPFISRDLFFRRDLYLFLI